MVAWCSKANQRAPKQADCMKAMATYLDMLIAMPIAILGMVIFMYSMHSFQNVAYAMSSRGSWMFRLYSLGQEISSTIYYSHLNYSSSMALANAIAPPGVDVSLQLGMDHSCNSGESCRFVEIESKAYTMVISSESPN